MPSIAEINRAETLDAEELGLTLVQIRTLKQNFRAFLGNRLPFTALSRWIVGTPDQLTREARAKYIASLLETELTR